MTRAGIILQARMGSQRLPRKSMALIAGRPVVEHCLRRLQARGVAPVILATTTAPEDDVLAELAQSLDIPAFRGSAADVLDRYAACARTFELELIVRATADNPGVDVDAASRLLDVLMQTGADYAREVGLPLGGGVEAITAAALARAASLADQPCDREHVTTFVRHRTDLFRTEERPAPLSLVRPDVRVTVDTWTDLQRMRQLYAATGREMPALEELIAAWDAVLRNAA
jgi:spore coat polysaccharide biosynthesis protein SpsF